MTKRLKIAVDARPLSQPMVGITRYTYELLSRLVHSEHEWFLYLDRKPVQAIPSLPNVHIRYGSINKPALSTLFAQCVFPIWARRDNVNVFWSPRHHLPVFLPSSIKQILTIHDMVWRRYPKTMSILGRWVEKIFMPPSLKKAQKILAVSNSTKRDVNFYYPHFSPKVSTIYAGLSHTPANTPLNPCATKPYFLFVGTLEPRKNLPRLLKAFALLLDHNKSISLVIAGGQGWGNEELADLIIAAKLNTKVILVGHVNEQDLASYYANAVALVMPSFYEGFGLPLLEAMGHGVPVISSNLGAMAEVTGNAGLLVDPYFKKDIADAMFAMLTPETREKFAKRALERSKLFDWDEAAKKALKEIEQL